MLLYKVCDIWLSDKKLRYAGDPAVARDPKRLGHLLHWLSYFSVQLKALQQYCPNISTFTTMLEKKLAYLQPIVKVYPNSPYLIVRMSRLKLRPT